MGGAGVTTSRYLATIAPESPDCDPLAEAEPKAEPDDDGEAWELDWDDDGVPCLAEQMERQERQWAPWRCSMTMDEINETKNGG